MQKTIKLSDNSAYVTNNSKLTDDSSWLTQKCFITSIFLLHNKMGVFWLLLSQFHIINSYKTKTKDKQRDKFEIN